MKSCVRSTFLIIISFSIIFGWVVSACASTSRKEIAVTPVPTLDRLASPVVPMHPSQADLGANVYYQVCMACHGDKGQGLTDEWRAVWGEDANCWQSECHGKDHPPNGFSFPENCCKAVLGPGTLTRFQNGQELFTYVITTMPWWNPGYLKTEEFWQVTAFLMRARGALPNEVTLDEHNAYVFNLHPPSPIRGDRRLDIWFVCAILATITSLVFLYNRVHSNKS